MHKLSQTERIARIFISGLILLGICSAAVAQEKSEPINNGSGAACPGVLQGKPAVCYLERTAADLTARALDLLPSCQRQLAIKETEAAASGSAAAHAASAVAVVQGAAALSGEALQACQEALKKAVSLATERPSRALWLGIGIATGFVAGGGVVALAVYGLPRLLTALGASKSALQWAPLGHRGGSRPASVGVPLIRF